MSPRSVSTGPPIPMARTSGEWAIVSTFRDHKKVPDHIMIRHHQVRHRLEDVDEYIEPIGVVIELTTEHESIVHGKRRACERSERLQSRVVPTQERIVNNLPIHLRRRHGADPR